MSDENPLLPVFVTDAPDAIQMYVGEVLPTTSTDSRTLVSATTNMALNSMFTFTCIATNANPAASVVWSLGATPLSNDVEVTQFDSTNADYDTYSTITTSPVTASECGMALSCTTYHPQSENSNPKTAQTTLRVGGMSKI